MIGRPAAELGEALRCEPAKAAALLSPFTSIMPAWSATNNIDLTREARLGFGAAAAAIARAYELSERGYDARQSALAKYDAVGFEAAAVTGLMIAVSARAAPPETPRRAVVRFRHPYAVVAATRNDARAVTDGLARPAGRRIRASWMHW